jgi:hypothetical protein
VAAHPIPPSVLGPIVKATLRCTLAEAELVDAVLDAGPLPFTHVVAALSTAGFRLSTCRQYHLHKAVVRPALPPPAVVHRWTNSLTLTLSSHHPMFDLPVTHLVLTSNAEEVARVSLGRTPANGLSRYNPSPPVTVVMGGLTPGTPYSLQASCVVEGDPALQASLVLSDPIVVRTLSPPGPPPAPVVVEPGPTRLCVRLMDVGAASDPPSTGMVLEVDGAVWDGPCEPLPDHGLLFRVEGLVEGTRHTLRCRCTVAGAAELDATLPWSPDTFVDGSGIPVQWGQDLCIEARTPSLAGVDPLAVAVAGARWLAPLVPVATSPRPNGAEHDSTFHEVQVWSPEVGIAPQVSLQHNGC